MKRSVSAVVFLVLVLGSVTPAFAGPKKLQWLRAFQAAPASKIAKDKRFRKFLVSITPPAQLDLGAGKLTLAKSLENILSSGTEPTKMEDEHTMLISGCRAPACKEKAIIWIDFERGVTLAGILHHHFEADNATPQLLLTSVTLDSKGLPPASRHAVRDWMKVQGIIPKAIRFVERSKKVEEMPVDALSE